MLLLKLGQFAADEVGFLFETNQRVDPRRAMRCMEAFIALAEARFPESEIEIVYLGRGSLAGKIVIYGAAFATIASFGKDVVQDLKSEESDFARCAAEMIVEHGVTKIKAITCDGPLEVLRDEIPAVAKALAKQDEDREIRPSGRGASPDHASLVALSQTPSLERWRGKVFTGQRFYVLHTDDGRRFELDVPDHLQPIPTAISLTIFGQMTDAGPMDMAEGVIEAFRWEAGEESVGAKKDGSSNAETASPGAISFIQGKFTKGPGGPWFHSEDNRPVLRTDFVPDGVDYDEPITVAVEILDRTNENGVSFAKILRVIKSV